MRNDIFINSETQNKCSKYSLFIYILACTRRIMSVAIFKMVPRRFRRLPRHKPMDSYLWGQPKVILKPWAAVKKAFCRYYQFLSGFLAKGHLPRVLRQSHLSANDNSDNEMIPESCIDLLAFTPQLKKHLTTVSL